MTPLDRRARPLDQPAVVGHRSLQSALPVLHAGGRVHAGCRAKTSSTSRRSLAWSGSSSAGVDALRLTGGEPLLRRDLPMLVAQLVGGGAVETWRSRPTASCCAGGRRAAAAGLQRITVSLDTLDAARFTRSRGRRAGTRPRGPGRRRARLSGLQDRHGASFAASTTTRSSALVDEAARLGAEIRFIEYMDVGGATRWTPDHVSRAREILAIADARVRRANRSSTTAGRPRRGSGCRTASRRHHRLHDRAVLRDVRPQPPDGRRHVVSLSLRRDRLGPARAVRGGADDERVAGADHGDWQARTDHGAEDRLPLRTARRSCR